MFIMKNGIRRHGKSKFIAPRGFVTPEKAQVHAQTLANSVRKRFRHLSRRFKRECIDCFRLYDWDSPDIRVVVDWYAGHLVVAEYERLQTGEEYLPLMARAVADALEVPPENVHVKRRHTNTTSGPRYTKMNSSNERFEVRERDLRFLVNLNDFLDTGLYSDHRDTRNIVRDRASGMDFLNLFSYTGAFTCAAAAGGAKTTASVDRSQAYLDWSADNLALNGLQGVRHSLIRSDVMKYLAKASAEGRRFTLAFVDPPSFFQDEKENVSFDVNRDHPALLRAVLKVMKPRSDLFFSTNHQRFEPRFEDFHFHGITELTPDSVPEDYRNRKIHRCWHIVC